VSGTLRAIPIVAAPSRPAPELPGACASGGCGGASPPARWGSAPAIANAPVVVDGVQIPPEAIAEEAQQHPAPDPASAWMSAARALVIREVLLREARRLRIDAQPECDERGRREVGEEALIRELLERHAPAAAPTDDECRRYYQANAVRFRVPDLFEAAHILVAPEGSDAAAWQEAERKARAIVEQVGDDRDAFAEAARAFSRCSSAQQGGMLGQVRRGELAPAVQSAIEALEEGTAGREPVRTRFGWHVLRLERRIEGRVLPFEHVKQRIADMLEARSWAVSSARYTATLLASARVEGVLIEAASLERELA
jgi:peptidyl-prolyl cis-trans isomerase C